MSNANNKKELFIQEVLDKTGSSTTVRLALSKGYDKGYQDAVEDACEYFGNYLMDIGYPDDWIRDSKVQLNGEQRFRKTMEK